jgi:spermidine/putrescine transport system substrate-binding protein
MYARSLFFKGAIIAFWVAIIGAVLYVDQLSFVDHTKTLNVFGWAGMFDPAFIAQFEKKTGIRVNISYYESNEELLVKLKATKGKGYDIIVPSDYTVHLLAQEGILKELDRSQLPFWDTLNPALLGHYYDPQNIYSMPYEWSILGIGYNKNFFKEPFDKTWGLVFDPVTVDYPIAMVNDVMMATTYASYYLFGNPSGITMEKLQEIEKLFKQQKQWVQAYSDFRADYLLASKDVKAGVVSSSYILRSMRENDHIGFFIPREGGQVTIENIAIPRTTDKEDLIYQFLRFLYSPENIVNNFKQFAFFPPTTNVFDEIDAPDEIKELINITPKTFEHLDFLKISDFVYPVTEQVLQDMWVHVKSW